jgi:hypothetical protein
MSKKQEQLNLVYQTAYKICMKNIANIPGSAQGGPANPLLLKPKESYFNSSFKVMFIGQETNGWENSFKDSKGVQHLLEVYDSFANDGITLKHNGQFTNAIKAFKSKFLEYSPDAEFVWSNIIKIGKDWDKGTPQKEILEWQEPWNDVQRQEMQILNPDTVIFLTGPNYDRYIRHVYEDVIISEVEGFTIRELAKVQSKHLPDNTYRTYHPGYLYRFGFYRVQDAIFNFIKQNNNKI